jgi:hypothetical protein
MEPYALNILKKYIEQNKQVVGGNLWQTRDNPMSRAIRMT